MTALHRTTDQSAEAQASPTSPSPLTLTPTLASLSDRDGYARLLAARYADFLGLSPRLAAAWRAFRTASPATRAEAEYELRCLEEEVGGEALTTLREAAEREACRSYARQVRASKPPGRPYLFESPATTIAADEIRDAKDTA
jgi:hypothetical protein